GRALSANALINEALYSSLLALSVVPSIEARFLRTVPSIGPLTFGPPNNPYTTQRPSTARQAAFCSQYEPPTQSNMTLTPFPLVAPNTRSLNSDFL
uniref:Uncharacterized protein n=1 Tax=Ciona intestinalis TaxID=7719 RepID=H2Y0D4_CIOIN